MKKAYNLLLLVYVVFYGCKANDTTTNSVYIPQAINKKVLVEFFTNSGCLPCIAPHNFFEQITSNSGVTINDTSVIVIAFHYPYPYPYDSLYRSNTVQNDARASYYNVVGTPYARLDGVRMNQFSSSNWSSQMNVEFNTTKYIDIALSNNFIAVSDSGIITVNVNPVSSISTTDNVIHLIITDSNILYVTAPSGITMQSDVMRFMITGTSGEAINLGQNVTLQKKYGISGLWNQDECYITAFVQSISTKQVLGVERIKVKL